MFYLLYTHLLYKYEYEDPSSADTNINIRGLAENGFDLDARELVGLVDNFGRVWTSSGLKWNEHTLDQT